MASKEFSKPQFVTMTEEELDNVAPIKYSDEFMAGFRESIKAHGGMKIPPNSIFLKPSRAYYVIQDLVENIFAAYTRLNDILSRQEAVIRKRWTKKTTKQREKILLECWPNMPARHRSDLQELCDHNYVATKNPPTDTRFQWPHISLEDLVSVNRLLLLLNSRGRNLPHVFAHADLRSCEAGRHCNRIRWTIVRGYMMVLAGQVSSQTYGNFMRIDSEEHLTNWYQHRFRFFPPMHGITILEVQQKILQFLVDCCRQILHDIPFEDLTNSTFAIQPEPPAIAVAETSYTQLATIAAEAPYRVPSRLDTARLLHLIQAKRTSAEDHVWNLREDPAYFAMSLTNLAEHHPQRLPDMYGKMAPCEKSETFWSENVRLLVQNGHTSFLWWDALFHKANILHQAVAGTFEKFDPCKPLPYNVEDAICQMIRDLDDLTGFTRRHLGDAVVCSPNLGRSVVRGTAASGTGNVAALMEDDQKADYLMSLFGIVFNYREGDSGTIGFETIVNEIQHVLDRDLAQKKRLSSHALDSFSEFALVSTIASDLSNLFPWSVDFPRIVHTSIFDSAQDTTDMQKLRAALHQKEVQWDVRSVLPISTKLYYPVHKAFNASNVEAARSAEANLDTMWAIIDEHFSARTGTTLQHIFSKYATQERDIRRTLRWKAPARALLEETASDDEALPGAFSSLSMEAEKPRRFQGEIPREKLKTRSLQPQ